jgi:SAM-dependent methyltransferase
MCFDKNAHDDFYRWQLENGVYGDYAGGTDCRIVCDLAVDARVAGGTILDIGCGTGTVAVALHQKFGQWVQYTGVELVGKVRAEFAAQGLRDTTLVAAAADAATLAGLPAASFDLVLCLFLLQDVCGAEGIALIAGIPRLLKSEGHVIWGLTVRDGPSQAGRRVPPKLAALGCPDHPVYTWGQKDFRDCMLANGLEIVRDSGKQDQNGNTEWYALTRRAV